MDDDFRTVFSFQTESMVGVENLHHGASRRRNNNLIGRFHRHAVADGFAGERFIRNLLQRYNVAGNRRNQRFDGFRVSDSLRFSSLSGYGCAVRRCSRRGNRATGNHFLHFIADGFGFRTHDNLDGLLVQFNHTGSAEALTGRVVNQRRVRHGQTQTGNTGINRFQVIRTADRRDVVGRQLG